MLNDLFVFLPKFVPVFFGCRLETVPVTLEIVCQIVHIFVKFALLANVAQVITIGFVPRRADDFFVAQIAQNGDVAFANRRPNAWPSAAT